jgi:hypothetical protein
MTKISFLAAGLAFASTTLALPRVVSLADAGREPISLKNVADDNAPCNKQSCEIANLAGSTGNLPTIRPEGGDANGYKCISRWSPETVAAANKAPRGPAQNTGIGGALTGAIASLGGALTFNPTVTGTFKGSCTKNIVIFARGTTETGLLGITVGPVLNTGLRGPNWSVVGVAYDADFAGDNCLGLPGGQVAKDMLNQAVKKCPTSKIFMSGYSEGAMVAHNGVAYAEEESKKHVAVCSC